MSKQGRYRSSLSALILILIILPFHFQVFFQLTVFKTFQVELIERYCVNKSQPELHCNGKCHLQKVEKSTSNKTPEMAFKWHELVALNVTYSVSLLHALNEIRPQAFNVYIARIYSGTIELPDPPPKIG